MSFAGLLSRMLMLLLLICVGVVCSKLRILDERGCASINQLVLYVCGPLLIIKSVLNVELSYGVRDILSLLLCSVILHVISLALSWICTRFLKRASDKRGVFMLVSTFGNIFFMGVPVVSALYGDNAVFLLSIFVIPFNLMMFTLGIYLVLGGRSQGVPWKKLLVNPSLYATILALPIFFFRIELPGTVQDIICYLSQMVIPLSMLLIGAALGRMTLKGIFGSGLSYAVCALKLVAVPLVMFCIFRLIVHDPLILGLVTVASAMPSASISPIVCAEYGGDSEFASRTVFLTTVLSLATIPAIVWLLLR